MARVLIGCWIMNKKFQLNYVEFYITNVCNLTCQGCNRFNSFKFKGWQKWEDYADTYKQWSEQIEFREIAIMGGEPFLNSSIYEWIEGLATLWPDSNICLTTNGTQIDKHPNLYSVLDKYRQVELDISLHNKVEKNKIIDKVKSILVLPLTYDFDNTPYRETLRVTDSNGVSILFRYSWWFHQGAIITDHVTGKYKLHDSDPDKAHDICHSKTCHHFDKGKLYKCGPAALFSEFDQQLNLELSDSDRTLINTVPYLEINDSIENKKQFIKDINDPIPQCKFCPEVYNGKQIFSIEKKEL